MQNRNFCGCSRNPGRTGTRAFQIDESGALASSQFPGMLQERRTGRHRAGCPKLLRAAPLRDCNYRGRYRNAGPPLTSGVLPPTCCEWPCRAVVSGVAAGIEHRTAWPQPSSLQFGRSDAVARLQVQGMLQERIPAMGTGRAASKWTSVALLLDRSLGGCCRSAGADGIGWAASELARAAHLQVHSYRGHNRDAGPSLALGRLRTYRLV